MIRSMELAVDVEIDEHRITDAAFRTQLPRARKDLLRFLAKTEHTSRQIRSYLKKRGYLDSVAADTLNWASSCGIADDERYASIYVRSHTDNSPMGNTRLRMELRRKGVDESIIDRVLNNRDDDDLEMVLVRAVRNRYGHLEGEKAFRRGVGYLRRRGFDSRLILSVLRSALGDQEKCPIEE